jgi:6-pyruvoyltetrahydropterin/6-carboxytetrahydropterin synthase
LKPLKKWLEDNFDHKTAIDKNDPHLDKFMELQSHDLCEVVVMDGVGAEKFAEHAFNYADALVRGLTNGRCYCVSAECAEHGSNSAIYEA